MENFTNTYMPYVNFVVTIITGIILILIIKHKNSLIETLTANFKSAQEMLNLYDTTKYKEYVNLREDSLKMKHKIELDQVMEDTKTNAETLVRKVAEPWLDQYDELLNFHIFILLKLPKDELDERLKYLPKNRETIMRLIADIESGKLKPNT